MSQYSWFISMSTWLASDHTKDIFLTTHRLTQDWGNSHNYLWHLDTENLYLLFDSGIFLLLMYYGESKYCTACGSLQVWLGEHPLQQQRYQPPPNHQEVQIKCDGLQNRDKRSDKKLYIIFSVFYSYQDVYKCSINLSRKWFIKINRKFAYNSVLH